MAELEKITHFKGGFSLRLKVCLLFFIIVSLLILLTTFAIYKVLDNRLFKELQNRVRNIAELGVKSIDISNLKHLIRLSSSKLSDEEVKKIEMSEDYKNICDALNWIRDISPEIISSVYIFTPGEAENKAKYIVDADTLKALESQSSDENISHFNQEFDISTYPVMKKAIKEKKVSVEEKYYFDYEEKVNSISAYAPIFEPKTGKLVALLGIDVTDKNVREILKSTVNVILAIGIAALLISIILSIFIGSSFTKGIRYLDRVVSRFGEKDFSIRENLNSKDEVGRLAFSFNIMAETIEDYSNEIVALLNAYDRFVPHDFLDFLSKKAL
ncbi:MAG: HAMP domain-containing protein [Brevinematia bacterium]